MDIKISRMNKIIAEFNQKIKNVSDFSMLGDEVDKKTKIMKIEFNEKLEAMEKGNIESSNRLVDKMNLVKKLANEKMKDIDSLVTES